MTEESVRSDGEESGSDQVPSAVEHGSGLGAFLKWGGKPHYLPFPYSCPTLPYPTLPPVNPFR